MIRLLLSLLILSFFSACSDDIPVNYPALQGVRDSIFYKADIAGAEVLEDGGVRLSGYNGQERLELKLNSTQPGTYLLDDKDNTAVFTFADGLIYTTETEGAGTISLDDVSENTFTGTFSFRAHATTIDTVPITFTKGVFYKVPITSQAIGSIDPDDPDNPDPVVATQLSCRINGVGYNPTEVFSAVSGSSISGYGSTRGIIIRLVFPRDIERGEYALGDISSSEPYRAGYNSSGIDSYIQNGTLQVTTHNREERSVGGRFSFYAENNGQVHVTEGLFGFNY